MIAALPMYDLAEIRDRTNVLWRAIADALTRRGFAGAPAELTRDRDEMAVWTAPELLLAQTCGYPLTHSLAGRVRLVATPCYAAPGCDGPAYCSLLVVRAGEAAALEDLRGRRAAFNMPSSQSGYAALRASVAPLARDGRFFGATVETGSHAASLAAVREGRADLCAVDAVTHALLARHRPDALEGLQVIGRSRPAPGLPLVTAGTLGDRDLALLRDALADVAGDPALALVRRDLLIGGFSIVAPADYDAIVQMEEDCRRRGYPELA